MEKDPALGEAAARLNQVEREIVRHREVRAAHLADAELQAVEIDKLAKIRDGWAQILESRGADEGHACGYGSRCPHNSTSRP